MTRRRPSALPTVIRSEPIQVEDADPWLKRTYGPVRTRIVGQVEKHLHVMRDQERRYSDVVHPSDVAKELWCQRRTAYELMHVSPSDDSHYGGHSLRIFDDGKLIHTKWQRWLWDMGVLEGEWRCRLCRLRYEATAPTECPACHADREHLQYLEVPVESEVLRIYGRADGKVGPALIEVKGISPGTVRVFAPATYYKWLESLDGTSKDPLRDLWDQVKRPFPEHRRQGLLYCAVTQVPEIIFIYEWKVTQAVKEFVVKRNDGLIAVVWTTWSRWSMTWRRVSSLTDLNRSNLMLLRVWSASTGAHAGVRVKRRADAEEPEDPPDTIDLIVQAFARDGEIPAMAEDVTELDDRDLMKWMTEAVEWRNYVDTLVATAQAELRRLTTELRRRRAELVLTVEGPNEDVRKATMETDSQGEGPAGRDPGAEGSRRDAGGSRRQPGSAHRQALQPRDHPPHRA